MRLRAVNLACILLLLSSLSAAEAAPLRSGAFGLGGHYVTALLAHDAANIAGDAPGSHAARGTLAFALQPASLAQHRAPWTMRPPSAHSAALHAVTASGL
jgi:hypothetical protein